MKTPIKDLEKLVKECLLQRGFKDETILNNRGLIGAVIEDMLHATKLHHIPKSKHKEDEKKSVYDWLKENDKLGGQLRCTV